MSSYGQSGSAPKRSTTLGQATSDLENIESRIQACTSLVHSLADQVTGSVAAIERSSDKPSPPALSIYQMTERINGSLNELNSALERFNQ